VADPTVLVVEHEPGAPAGWFGEHLERVGCRLDVRRPYAGDPLPGPDELDGTDSIDGIVVLGGSVDAWEESAAPWLVDNRTLVRAADARGLPVLGICLGHQVATAALGGEVDRNPAGATLAVLPVAWAAEAEDDPLFAGVVGSRWAVHWNNDVVSVLPPGAQVLATSPDGAVQAARLARHVWGVQFHPEAGPEIVGRWVTDDGAAYVAAGFDLEQYLSDIRGHEPELRETCERLAGSFVQLVAPRLTSR
jgi:GMP synthase (glutamine-hydrolysing)